MRYCAWSCSAAPSCLARYEPTPLPTALCSNPQDLYVGLTPYSAPAVFGLLAGTELTDGVWYPRGGFQRVMTQELLPLLDS